jgi:hypothetical protein
VQTRAKDFFLRIRFLFAYNIEQRGMGDELAAGGNHGADKTAERGFGFPYKLY